MSIVKKLSLAKGKKMAYKLIDLLTQEQEENASIPEEVKELVRERILHAKQNPEETIDWETAMKRIKVIK